VAEAPEVLAVVVEPPGGARQDMAGGKFEEQSVDVAVQIVLGLIGQAAQKTVHGEGNEEMPVVDVVEGEHGAAGEEKFAGELLVAHRFEGNANGGVGFGEERSNGQQKEQRKAEEAEMAGARGRNGTLGNRHGKVRVSISVSRVALLFHRRTNTARGCRRSHPIRGKITLHG